jgi:hypothetical protein
VPYRDGSLKKIIDLSPQRTQRKEDKMSLRDLGVLAVKYRLPPAVHSEAGHPPAQRWEFVCLTHRKSVRGNARKIVHYPYFISIR